ncbi:MAG: YraN family protein [Acidimicrobiales bacterium]|nr:YraN family protein [Acidimicrobiales bacterium]
MLQHPPSPETAHAPHRHNQRLGEWGEGRAVRWYRKRGYRILDRNWRSGRHGELDLVVERRGTVVFAEVKTRTSTRYGQPIEAVTEAKAHRIRRLGARWLRAHAVYARSVRYDVVAIVGPRLEVHEDVF